MSKKKIIMTQQLKNEIDQLFDFEVWAIQIKRDRFLILF